MKKRHQFLALLLCVSLSLFSQRTPLKDHTPWPYIGNAKLVYSWGEAGTGFSDKVFQVNTLQDGVYQLRIRASLVYGENLYLHVNGSNTGIIFTGTSPGWIQYTAAIRLRHGTQLITLRNSSHIMVPLAENPELEFIGYDKPVSTEAINNLPENNPLSTTTGRTLPNPAGNYEHDIETAFSYTTFVWVYLKQGSRYIFTTSNTNQVNPVLHLFNPAAITTQSWMNDNATTGTVESRIDIVAPVTGYYVLMVRATKSVSPGTNAYTYLFCNNSLMVERALIGGNVFRSSFGATPDALNFFTCGLSQPQADTRMILINGQNYAATFYNDDYISTGGDWPWGFASRINSVWPSGHKPYQTYVCAYSPFTEGVADTYMGNRNSIAYQWFTNWKADDCIQAGVGFPITPNPYHYNCIGWSGGLTDAFYWPGQYFSTWTVYGNDLASFDNYYGNNPARYPGAYTYTRTGATFSNAVVDLWATTNGGSGLYYTHGSVQKPGNNHPHGYDWESKPGSLERSFHPRLGPAGETNANYGTPVNFYIHTGTYARTTGTQKSYASAEESVEAGVAVFDNPVLSDKAGNRLKELLAASGSKNGSRFNHLYENWKSTWKDNAVQSNPAAYCRNEAYKELQAWCKEHTYEATLLLCEKYSNGDFLCGDLLCDLTLNRYMHLLDEVKREYKNNLYDASGRYRIRSDYGNGICYIEKLLAVIPATPLVAEAGIQITTSPNPVKDVLQISFSLKEAKQVAVHITSMQTLKTKQVQQPVLLSPGVHRFSVTVAGLAGGTGDILTVQVMANGEPTTVKVLVSRM